MSDAPRQESPPSDSLWLWTTLMSIVVFGILTFASDADAEILLLPAAILTPVISLAAQSSFEIVIARAWGMRFSWRVFKTWCAGIVIGYGVVGVSMMATGYTISLFEWGVPGCEAVRLRDQVAEHWPRLMSALVLVIAVQYWVVRRALRTSESIELISRGGLLLGCIAAKLVTGLLWTVAGPVALISLAACR